VRRGKLLAEQARNDLAALDRAFGIGKAFDVFGKFARDPARVIDRKQPMTPAR